MDSKTYYRDAHWRERGNHRHAYIGTHIGIEGTHKYSRGTHIGGRGGNSRFHKQDKGLCFPFFKSPISSYFLNSRF